MKKSKSKPKLGIATKLQAAVSKTGLSVAVIKAAQSKGCDAFKPNGRIDCDKLVAFVADMPKPDDSVPDYFMERARDIRANRMLKEQKLSERQKLVWPKDGIRSAWTRSVLSLKIKLRDSANQISAESGMKLGLTAEQIDSLRTVVSNHHKRVMIEMHKGEWCQVLCPHCEKEISDK